MAFNLTYTITSGVTPVTVELLLSGKAPNTHLSIPSQDSFDNVPDGTYTLRFTDSMGCVETYSFTYPTTYPEAEYSLLYNYYTIEDLNNIAPDGYRVARLEDIVDLLDYLGGTSVAGGKLKAIETWTSPNTGATDEVGFTSIPDGYRTELGIFMEKLFESRIWIDNR